GVSYQYPRYRSQVTLFPMLQFSSRSYHVLVILSAKSMPFPLAVVLMSSHTSRYLRLSRVREESDMHMSTSSTYDMVMDVISGCDSILGSMMLLTYAPNR